MRKSKIIRIIAGFLHRRAGDFQAGDGPGMDAGTGIVIDSLGLRLETDAGGADAGFQQTALRKRQIRKYRAVGMAGHDNRKGL